MSTFTHIKHFFPLAGQSCCLDQLGAPDLLQSIFLYFMFRSVCSLMGFFVSSRHVGFSSPLPFHVSHLISYICILVWLVCIYGVPYTRSIRRLLQNSLKVLPVNELASSVVNSFGMLFKFIYCCSKV